MELSFSLWRQSDAVHFAERKLVCVSVPVRPSVNDTGTVAKVPRKLEPPSASARLYPGRDTAGARGSFARKFQPQCQRLARILGSLAGVFWRAALGSNFRAIVSSAVRGSSESNGAAGGVGEA